MTDSQKTPSSMVICLIEATLGFCLGLFVVSILITGFWAFVLAFAGGISISVAGRCTRIINRTLKGAAVSFIIGFLANLVLLIWVGLRLELTANLWAGALLVFTQGIFQIFVTDAMLTHWLTALFPGLVSGNGRNGKAA